MILLPPRSTRTDTLFPYTTLFRSDAVIANPQHTSLRPDFSLLVYPVISMRPELTHGGSKKNLLGDHPTADDITRFSNRSEEHTSELQSLMRISYAVFCLKKKNYP